MKRLAAALLNLLAAARLPLLAAALLPCGALAPLRYGAPALGPAPAFAATTLQVRSAADSGPGTLRNAINKANREPGSTIEITIDPAEVILVETALPALKARGTRLLGGGATLREAGGCVRADGRPGCDGIVVSAEGVVVRELRVAGFTFDGVAVRGGRARDVRIERVHAIDNLDDGIGVSGGATGVVIDDCVLMGNGFRSKGKGLLVFDHAQALLRDSVVVANRDGITVSDGGRAELERVLVAASYDKGVGVSGGTLHGRDVRIFTSGRNDGPNADGLRVGLKGIAGLFDCRIAGSGDTGVVVLDRSSVELEGCVLEANEAATESVAASARLIKR